MTDDPHLETEPAVLGPDSARGAVLVHGRGSGPEAMLDLARRLAAVGVRCVLPGVARTRESADILPVAGARVGLRVYQPSAHAIRGDEADTVAALVAG